VCPWRLHRPELRGIWDFSVFLDVPFGVTIARCAGRDGTGSPGPDDIAMAPYVRGQQRYLRECQPQATASAVLCNADFANPSLIAWRALP
jgi:uridine kinase